VNDKKIKVTDKRLFTAEGELREEYRHRNETTTESAPSVDPGPSPPETAEPPPSATEAMGQGPVDDLPVEPSFFDLVAAVAQPIALYLGDVKMPDGESMENLQLARMHIDLLEILQQKSAGNLNDQEKAFLEDLLYQLRLRYVEKSRSSGGT
jgi:hypothetical protein